VVGGEPTKAIELVVLVGSVVGVLVDVGPGCAVDPGVVGSGDEVVGPADVDDGEEFVVVVAVGGGVVGVSSLNTSIVADPQVNPPTFTIWQAWIS